MQFSELTSGNSARIIGYAAGNPVYRQRLIAMGLIPDTKFIVLRVAPLGDPIEILVRGFALSLRKHEAAILQIEKE